MFRYLSIAIALAAVATDIVAFASTTGPCNLTVTGGSVNTCACPGGQAGLPACVGSVVNTSNQSVCGNTNQESCSNTAVPIMTTYSCMTTSGANCTGITMNWNCVQNGGVRCHDSRRNQLCGLGTRGDAPLYVAGPAAFSDVEYATGLRIGVRGGPR